MQLTTHQTRESWDETYDAGAVPWACGVLFRLSQIGVHFPRHEREVNVGRRTASRAHDSTRTMTHGCTRSY